MQFHIFGGYFLVFLKKKLNERNLIKFLNFFHETRLVDSDQPSLTLTIDVYFLKNENLGVK